MKNHQLSTLIKNLRTAKGYSQDHLATQTQLSLRTIQRIESGETEPRGDSLQRLAAALGVNMSELVLAPQPVLEQDKNYLTIIHLSALSFIVFPLFGVLLPYILWVAKGKQVEGIDKTARRVLNFQITWCIIFIIFNGLMIGGAIFHFVNPLRLLPDLVLFFMVPGMYVYNILFIVVNAIREYNGKSLFYQPALPLLRRQKSAY